MPQEDTASMDKRPHAKSGMMIFAKVCMWTLGSLLLYTIVTQPKLLVVTNASKMASEALTGTSVTQVQAILYFYGVLGVRFLWWVMKGVLHCKFPYYRRQSTEHKNKTATMLIKGVYYLLGFFYMLPLTWIVGKHLLDGATPDLDAFWSH